MKLAILTLALAVSALAQTPGIRGTVTEYSSNAPIAGVEITLTEFIADAEGELSPKIVGTVFTDSSGFYQFKVERLNNYLLDVKKDGYQGIIKNFLSLVALTPRLTSRFWLTPAQPVAQVNFQLDRPGRITGRVLDEEGNPVSGLLVSSMPPGLSPLMETQAARTGTDGVFTIPNLPPAPFLIHIAPQAGENWVMPKFLADDFSIVDHDIEESYWPGGVPLASLALPLRVPPGAATSVGDLRVRRIDYHRVRVTTPGACQPRETWLYFIAKNPPEPGFTMPVLCGEQFLLTQVKPGSYNLVVYKATAPAKWGLAPFVVTKENIDVALTFSPGVAVSGKVTAAEGSKIADLGNVDVTFRSSMQGLTFSEKVTIDPDGSFVSKELLWPRHIVALAPRLPSTYVKELSYNHQPVIGQTIDLVPGAELEIVLDAQAPSITGTVKENDRAVENAYVVITRWPTPQTGLSLNDPMVLRVRTNSAGEFQLRSLAPGDYHIVAVSAQAVGQLENPGVLDRVLRSGEKITLSRGGQQTVQLKPTTLR